MPITVPESPIVVPVSGVAPAISGLPTVFQKLEDRVALIEKEIANHLQSFSLGTLEKLSALAKANQPLPWGLDKWRTEIVRFLEIAIAWAKDAIIAAQLVLQLTSIAAVPMAAG